MNVELATVTHVLLQDGKWYDAVDGSLAIDTEPTLGELPLGEPWLRFTSYDQRAANRTFPMRVPLSQVAAVRTSEAGS